MIADILPPVVAVQEAFGYLPDVALFPEEEAAIAVLQHVMISPTTIGDLAKAVLVLV